MGNTFSRRAPTHVVRKEARGPTVPDLARDPARSETQPHDERLLDAARYTRLDQVQNALSKGGNVNVQDTKGRSALYLAAEGGSRLEGLAVVRTLLEAGGDPNLAESEDSWTPIMVASQNGDLEVGA